MIDCGWLPGILDYFDAVDILALIVLLFTLTLVNFGNLELSQRMINVIIYICLGTMFGNKFIKGYRK